MSSGKKWERELLQTFRRALHPQHYYAERITDNTYKRYGKQYSHKTKADLIICYDSIDLLIECKARKAKSIPFDALAEHQHDALKTFSNISPQHKGIIAAMFYNGQRGRGRLHKGYLIPWTAWDAWSQRLKRKSIPLKELENSSKVVELAWKKQKETGKMGWSLPRGWREVLAPSVAVVTSPPRSTGPTVSPATRRTFKQNAAAVSKMVGDEKKRRERRG